MTSRRTIARATAVSGVGLHYGRACRLSFEPAEPGRGIVFRRVDLPSTPETPALASVAELAERRTQLGTGESALHTVEHVLAAVAGSGVDDVTISMDSPEPPILDGSSRPFVAALMEAGVVEHGGAAQYLRLRRPVRVVDGDSTYDAHPAESLVLDVRIEFSHPLVGAQRGTYEVTPESFRRELCGARTFGFMREVEALRAKGLIRGATTSNVVALDEEGVVETTLRWPDEFVRHKAMDFVGDLALAGKRVLARITATRPSHRGTVLLVREMLAQARREENVLSIEEVMKVLPHRYPFLLVDRVLELEERRIVGIKNVTINEPFFDGHFPGHPIMPGVLIVEAMAQVGGMLLMGTVQDPDSKVVYFMSLDKVKFRRPVKPGDQLRLELELLQVRGKICRMQGVAKVDGEVACEAEMAAMVRDR